MSHPWDEVARKEQELRNHQHDHDKFHPTQETYRIEQEHAKEENPVSGFVGRIKQALMKMLGRG